MSHALIAMSRSLLLPLLVAALACCVREPRAGHRDVNPAAATPAAAILTDAEHYRLEQGPSGLQVTIVTTFRAPADTPVYIANCNGGISTGLQRLMNGVWIDVWQPVLNECLSQPIVVPPGGARTERIVAVSGEFPRGEPRPNARLEPGTYRAVWHRLMTKYEVQPPSFGTELPLEQRVSAPFVIDASLPPRVRLPLGERLS